MNLNDQYMGICFKTIVKELPLNIHFLLQIKPIGLDLCSAALISMDKKKKNHCKLSYFSEALISMIFCGAIKQTTRSFIIRSISNKLAQEKQCGQFVGIVIDHGSYVSRVFWRLH